MPHVADPAFPGDFRLNRNAQRLGEQQGAPAVFKAYISMYDPARADSVRYVRVDDSVYNGLRRIAAGIDDDILQTKK